MDLLAIEEIRRVEYRCLRGDAGRWRISHTGYVRTDEATLSLDGPPSLWFTANRSVPPPGSAPPGDQR